MQEFTIQSLQFADKLSEAKRELAEIDFRAMKMREHRNAMLPHAWRLGGILIELKEAIGHGKWLFWCRENWPELSERTTQRCMGFFRDNPDWKEVKSDEFVGFNRESVRKLSGFYSPVPIKERLVLPGDVTDSPAPHHLTPVNHFTKYYRQVRSGLGDWPDPEIFRREIEPTLQIVLALSGATEFKVSASGVIWNFVST
jgi:hypothetical protein